MKNYAKILPVLGLLTICQSYGMGDERKEAKQEKKNQNSSTSLPSSTNHPVENAWFHYVQYKKAHPTSTKGLAKSNSIKIFEVALEALTIIGFNPNAINIIIKEDIDGTHISKSKKTIYIPKYYSTIDQLIERLLWDLTYATQFLNTNNSSDQKRNKFETITSTIRLLSQKKIYGPIGLQLLFLIQCILGGAQSPSPVPFQEQYDYIARLLKEADIHIRGKITKISDNLAQISLFIKERNQRIAIVGEAFAIVPLHPADYERFTVRFQIEELSDSEVLTNFPSSMSAPNSPLSSPTQNAIQILASLISQLHDSATQASHEESNRNAAAPAASMSTQSAGTASAQTSNQSATVTTTSGSTSSVTTASCPASSSQQCTSRCVIQ